MKNILVSIDNIKEVVPAINSGATELYCGVNGVNGILNAYSTVPHANISGFNELSEIINLSHSLNIPIYLARNSRDMSDKEVDLAVKETEIATDLGIDGVIVADFRLLKGLVDKNLTIKIISSSLMPTFNSETIKLYKSLGINRIILSKQLSISEMLQIVKSTQDIEFEIFVFYQRCPNIDAFCRIDHDLFKTYHPSGVVTLEIGKIENEDSSIQNPQEFSSPKISCPLMGCGICGLWFFNDIKDLSFKIPCRGRNIGNKIKAIKLVSNMIQILQSEFLNLNEYRKLAKNSFKNLFGAKCRQSFCYCEGPWKEDILYQQQKRVPQFMA